MEPKPVRKMAKVHSQAHADAYSAAGWELAREFRGPGDDLPYEYLLVWRGDDEPAKVVFPPRAAL